MPDRDHCEIAARLLLGIATTPDGGALDTARAVKVMVAAYHLTCGGVAVMSAGVAGALCTCLVWHRRGPAHAVLWASDGVVQVIDPEGKTVYAQGDGAALSAALLRLAERGGAARRALAERALDAQEGEG